MEANLPSPGDFDAWRAAARRLLQDGVEPQEVQWQVGGEAPLLPLVATNARSDEQPGAALRQFRVSRDFVAKARLAILHTDPRRFGLLYRLLWRLTHEQPALLEINTDPDVIAVERLIKSVQRDIHKMKAFLRFRQIDAAPASSAAPAAPRFIAWFEPEHHILSEAAPFFARRFANMNFSIVTPTQSVHWDGHALEFGPGGNKSEVPAEDAEEELWRIYYANIFNPARLNLSAMQKEMPKKYWKNLPEASLIPLLSDVAPVRTEEMVAAPPTLPRRGGARAAPRVSEVTPASRAAPEPSLSSLRDAIAQCRQCELWRAATQTVFGEGPASARLMFVGEQPGDQEDLAGHPFVGPAGQILDAACAEAGIDRSEVYVTNAVKHFKFIVRGKQRLHKSPSVIEIEVCSTWLEQELQAVRPALVVALGASAARALLGKAVGVQANRGKLMPYGQAQLLITVHPSYLLRLPSALARQTEMQAFVRDLRLATDVAKR